jgi:hypothetical protein
MMTLLPGPIFGKTAVAMTPEEAEYERRLLTLRVAADHGFTPANDAQTADEHARLCALAGVLFGVRGATARARVAADAARLVLDDEPGSRDPRT